MFRDSSIVGGFGTDSLVGKADFVRGSTVYGGSPSTVQAHWMALISSALVVLFLPLLSTAIPVLIHF